MTTISTSVADRRPSMQPSIATQKYSHLTIQAVDAVGPQLSAPQLSAPQPVAPQTNCAGELSDLAAEVGDAPGALPAGGRSQRLCTKLPRKLLVLLRKHGVLLIACGGSLAIGSGLANCMRPATRSQVPQLDPVATTADHQVVFASALHRHEPIGPLVPFDHLDEAVVQLGRRLFHEPGLSTSGTVACASCHPLDGGGTVHVPLPRNADEATASYNAPTVFNSALNFAQSWSGGVSTLEKYIDTSITMPHELGSSWERVIKFLSSDPDYRDTFAKVMLGEPSPETIRAALATFQRSLITVNSKFDQWLQGTEAALGSDEFGGYFLFKKFGCISCHQGMGVGGTMFQPLGIAKPYFGNQSNPADLGRFNITGQERDRHVFRVPPLRNVELTAPYFHDGSIPTLEAAIALMIEYQCGQEFNAEDVRRLTAFLNSLTGEIPASAAGQLHGSAGHNRSITPSARAPHDRVRRSAENRVRPNGK